MSGGSYSRRQLERGQSLEQRTAPAALEQPRACWLRGDQPVPGHIVAWQHDQSGQWQAVVVVVVAADRLDPR